MMFRNRNNVVIESGHQHRIQFKCTHSLKPAQTP
jgi:hypothetical protein